MLKDTRSKFFVTLKGVEHGDSQEEELDDDFILELANLIFEDEAQMRTVVEERVEEVKLSAEILRQIVEGYNLWIECRVHDPAPSMGCVSVIGEDIVIDDMDQFQRVAELASNFEVYADVSGAIHMDFTFHGLMRR